MDITFTGTITLQHVRPDQLIEMAIEFTKLVGRTPKLTVKTSASPNFCLVTEVQDDKLIYTNPRTGQPEAAYPSKVRDNTYDAVAMF